MTAWMAPRVAATVRAAQAADVRAIERLLAPEVAAGTILDRPVAAGDFLVAEDPEGLAGAVAMRPWTAAVVELGSLVSARPGRGIGGALCEAVTARAAREGYGLVVALTGAPSFFLRRRFQAWGETPRERALVGGAPGGCSRADALGAAIGVQARACVACPKLTSCRQSLLVREVAA